ncbi:MAG: hypothetical protein HOV71_09655 [Hamadaea sp.]|nr:hypothetical protein [Hamadaea sp.]NUT03450.1 hypothetical protein [Hamadaea sp.]
MKEGAVVFVAIGLGLGMLMGARWVRMKGARSGWRGAKAGVPKAKAAKKAAFSGYMSHTRQAFFMILVIVAVFFVLMKISQAS